MKKILLTLSIVLFLSGCTTQTPQTEKPISPIDEIQIPRNCVNWFDGCNNCGAKDGKLTMCTEMACEKLAPSKCTKFAEENPAKICNEGDKQACIIMPNGNKDCIADAIHVCRNGKWKIEGGMPFKPFNEKICTMEYSPVCGEIDTGIRCIQAPCPSFEQKTFSNNCMAKSAGAKVLYQGECKKEITKKPIIPQNCTNWFDGCNNCMVMKDGGLACTKMMCFEKKEAYCTKFKE